MRQYLTYDDVTIPPRYSEIRSRQDENEVNISGQLTETRKLSIPIISAPMDTVTGIDMAVELNRLGAIGCVHRFMSIDEQVSLYKEFQKRTQTQELPFPKYGSVIMSIGVTGDWWERFQALYSEGCSLFCLDVAHGHHILVKEALEKLKNEDEYALEIIAGNIATMQAAYDLIKWGADALRVGVGGGSVCETRIRTGVGVPMVSCLRDVCSVASHYDIPVIADGGIRQFGDIPKALACGASTVMLGSMLAGTKETPTPRIEIDGQSVKSYRGSASAEAKSERGETRHVEGASALVPYKGHVQHTIESVKDAITSAFSYTGSPTIEEFHRNATLGQITSAGNHEAQPHLLLK